MAKLIPLSLLILTIAVPTYMSTRPRPRKALKTTQLFMAAYIVLWAFLCLYVYTQYVHIE
jgi:hypothetical protein